VFDLNSNGVMDAVDPHAFTDDDGYFSYNPLTGTNYCALASSEYCLEVTPFTKGPILIEGGYEIATGEPFYGQLRLNAYVSPDRPITELDIVSPVTTLLSYAQDQADKTRILGALNIEESDLKRNFYNGTQSVSSIEKNKKMAEVTQKVHKVVSAISKRSEGVYTVFGDEAGLPRDISSFGYSALTDVLLDKSIIADANLSSTSLSNILKNTDNMAAIVEKANQKVQARLLASNYTLPSNVSSLGTSATSDDVVRFSKIDDIIARIFASLSPNTAPTGQNTKGIVKLIDTTIEKIAKQKPTAELDALIATLTNTTQRDALLMELGKDSTNVAELVDTDLSDQTEVDNITVTDKEPVFNNLAGKRLEFSDSDLSLDRDRSAVLYFKSDNGSTNRGEVFACVRIIDGVNMNGQLDAGGTLGTFSPVGTWVTINNGYGVIFDITLAGAPKYATIQYGGMNSNQETSYRTDLVGSLDTWLGNAPVVHDASLTPTTDAGCQTELDDIDPVDSSLFNKITS